MSKQKHVAGFTIVELMIATAIFSAVLLLLSTAIIQMGRAYYKGLNESRNSAATSAIMNELAQSIKFSGQQVIDNIDTTPTPTDVKGLCIGERMYSYIYGQAVDGTHHGLVSYKVASCDSSYLVDPSVAMSMSSAEPRELLGRGMRLSNLAITGGGTAPVGITIRVISSPDDLLCTHDSGIIGTDANADCDGSGDITTTSIKQARDLGCKQRTGSQFCTVSQLSTTVVKRVSGGGS